MQTTWLQEQEQENVAKFAKYNYSRSDEEHIPFRFKSLAMAPTLKANGVYPFSEFAVKGAWNMAQSIAFPDCLPFICAAKPELLQASPRLMKIGRAS